MRRKERREGKYFNLMEEIKVARYKWQGQIEARIKKRESWRKERKMSASNKISLIQLQSAVDRVRHRQTSSQLPT